MRHASVMRARHELGEGVARGAAEEARERALAHARVAADAFQRELLRAVRVDVREHLLDLARRAGVVQRGVGRRQRAA
jgi:hypothetical protein